VAVEALVAYVATVEDGKLVRLRISTHRRRPSRPPSCGGRRMSRKNVEIVRRGYEHFNRSGEVDYSVLDPEIVYDLSRRTFDPLVFHGHEGVREFPSFLWEQWASRRMEPQDLIEAGDKVVASVRLVGVGRKSGVETRANAAHVWTFSEGKIVRLTVFETMEEALEAVGLGE
jgi:ketosteroid isomerase-like protein